MISIQEVHFYNNLVDVNKLNSLIVCPFVKDDIVVSRVDEDDKPYFYCISCRTTFKLTSDIEHTINTIIKKFLK
jgi:hypothetical protein